jgi:hypothetical protein
MIIFIPKGGVGKGSLKEDMIFIGIFIITVIIGLIPILLIEYMNDNLSLLGDFSKTWLYLWWKGN